jgi:hypothetical protein
VPWPALAASFSLGSPPALEPAVSQTTVSETQPALEARPSQPSDGSANLVSAAPSAPLP